MYCQNDVNQIGLSASHLRPAEGSQAAGGDALPTIQFVTDGRGNVYPLGNTTDNSAIRTQQGFQAIKERFKLLDSARKILDGERTQHCFYNRVDKNDGVGVTFNKFRNKANYTNVMRCANAWGCPVCAAIISEHRKCEVKEAMDWWKKQGGSVLLLTLTVPHYSDTDIKQLKKDLKKAYGKFFKGVRASKDMFERWQIKHYISCFEITHGLNGFHPHYHVLLFMRHTVNIDGLRSFLALQWQNCCKKAGLPIPSLEHGVDLQDGTFADEYVSKWGLEDEMTKGHTKKGRKDSLTPFDLLRQSVECPEYGKLFQVFANAFKGKTQLRWSKGLKARLGVGERSDQELAEETDNEAYFVRELAFEIWVLIAKYKQRAEFLQAIDRIL